MEIILQRFCSNEDGTFGVLIKDNIPFMCTLELPWKDNATDISCIPLGAYQCNKIHSPHFNKDLFVVTGVPGRSNVEMHIGNTIKDSHGCILLGSMFSESWNAIVESVKAFNLFMQTMPSEGFTLRINGIIG